MRNTAKKKFHVLGRMTALAAVAGLALTACGDGETADTGSGEGGDEINIAINHGWEEGIAVAELWSLILEDEGYSVRTSKDAEEALTAIGARRPNLLLLDIWLEGSRRRHD